MHKYNIKYYYIIYAYVASLLNFVGVTPCQVSPGSTSSDNFRPQCDADACSRTYWEYGIVL